MRKILLSAVFIISIFYQVLAAKYYVDATLGLDSNPGSIAAPWKTLAKVNSVTFASGDSVFFKRGEVWYGSVVPKVNNVNFAAYGTGAKPLISGFTTITSWTPHGSGKYSAIVSNIKTSTFNLLSINGQPQGKGRYPNITAANQGYLTYAAGDTSKIWGTVTGTNRVGDDVIVRAKYWRLEKGLVTGQNADTIRYQRVFDLGNGQAQRFETPTPKFGYFFQNDSTYVDQFGEWFLNTSTKRLMIYFGTNPSAYSVRVATVDTLFNVSNKSGLTITDMAFEGGNLYGIYGTVSSGLSITNCDFNQFGAQAIGFNRMGDFTIQNNNIKNALATAIYCQNGTVNNLTINNNTVDSIGLIPGMGSYNQSCDYQGIGVSILSNLNIRYNTISNIGMDGMRWQGNNVDIGYNYIYEFCKTLADHGAIYTYDANGSTIYSNRRIHNNFIRNGVGNMFGTSDTIKVDVVGIYMDGTSNNYTIDSNTIWKMPGNSIQMNAPNNVNVRSNIILLDSVGSRYNSKAINYNNNNGGGTVVGPDTITNLNIKNNIAYIFKNQQSIQYCVNRLTTGTSLQASMRSFGTIDSNYFNKATTGVYDIEYYAPSYTLLSNTLAQWRTLTLYDQHTVTLRDLPQDSITLLNNISAVNQDFYLPAKYKDIYNNIYQGVTNLDPYQSLFLMYYAPLDTTVIPTPGTLSLSPSSGIVTGSGFTLTVNGSNFLNGVSTVRWNGSDRVTTFVSASQLTAAITASDNAITNGGTTASVTVLNTGNPTVSNAQTYTLTPATPTTTSISPTTGTANGSGFTLTVNGTNFISGISTVRWNGSPRATTFVNSTQLTAVITATDNAISKGGTTASVTVLNTGNATASNAQTYTLIPATPTTSSISPTSGTADGNSFVITVNGANFISGISAVRWAGSNRVTTFVSSSQLTAVITSADNAVANGGSGANITVINTGNPVQSNAQVYTMNAATPTTSSVSPSSGTADGNGFTITVNGTNFINGISTVRWNGSNRATTFVSSTQLTASITASDNAVANGGTTASITVLNSGNVTASNAQTYTLTAATPTTTSLSPSSGTASGSGFTLTVNGTNFINGISTVRINGNSRSTTFVSSTQLTAAITAGDNAIANGGSTASITVLNTGNATVSNAQTYTFTPATPTTTSISPTSDTADGNLFIMTVNGTNFISGISTVRWNGSARTTTFISSTQLTAVITATDNAIANGNTTASITVLNTGNVTASNAQTYTLIPAPPATSSLSPSSGIADGNGFTLTVNGSNFISGVSTVRWNGSSRTTTFLSSTQITAAITAADNAIANAGTTASVTVLNTGNATVSNAQTYSLTSAVPGNPTILSLSPSSGTANGSGFTITVNGTNYINGVTFIRWNNAIIPTTFVSSIQMTATVTGTQNAVANGGTFANITVLNTTTSAVSNIEAYSLIAATPVISSISPSSAVPNNRSFVLTVNGSNFINGKSVVRWNGTSRTTNFISATRLQAVITKNDNLRIKAGSTASITVLTTSNSTPSNTVIYTLLPIPKYAVTALPVNKTAKSTN